MVLVLAHLWCLTKAAEKTQEAVDEMNDHQEYLEEVDAQKKGEEGHVPKDSVSRFQADRAPEWMIVQIIPVMQIFEWVAIFPSLRLIERWDIEHAKRTVF